MGIRRGGRITPPRPAVTSGYLYYVRIKAEQGVFYKIGFTTFDSVQARLRQFGRPGDEDLVDHILLFEHFEDAFDIESKLHRSLLKKRAFSPFRQRTQMPLFRNGQSELYYDDVLGLDSAFSEEVAQRTRYNVRLFRANEWCYTETIARGVLVVEDLVIRIATALTGSKRQPTEESEKLIAQLKANLNARRRVRLQEAIDKMGPELRAEIFAGMRK